MTRTIGAAIGAVIVALFFIYGVAHSPRPSSQPEGTVAAGR